MRGVPSSWRMTTLGENVDLLTGHPFKSKSFSDRPSDIRLLRGDNVAQGILRWDGAKRWCANEYNNLEKFHLKKGDVILAMDRPWISAGLKYAWIKQCDIPSLLVQRVARMRGINNLTTDYLRYLIGSPSFTEHVLSITTGINVPHISAKDIKAFRFCLPPIATQIKIVSFLKSYDDLIENNTRRIEILESIAWRIYFEWFIHFRFPGHDHKLRTQRNDDTTPQGWERACIADLAQLITRGISPAYDDNSPCTVINQKCIRDFRINLSHARNNRKSFSKDKLLLAGDVLINSTGVGTLGRVAQVCERIPNCTVDSHVTIARPKSNINTHYWGYLLMEKQIHFERMGVGSTGQTELSRSAIGSTPVLLAPRELQIKFGKLIAPLREQCLLLAQKNEALQKTRKLLLPQLISGEIDVSAMPDPAEM